MHDRSDHDLTDPGSYGHWTDEHVRFSDTDAMGHVNNVAVAAYVESSRVGFGTSLTAGLDDHRRVILRRVDIEFLAELHYPGELRVGSRVLAVGRTSFTVGTGVFLDDRCVATATSVLVVLGDTGPVTIDGAARELLEAAAAA